MAIKFYNKHEKNRTENGIYSLFHCYDVDSWIDLEKLDRLFCARMQNRFENMLKIPLEMEKREIPIIRNDYNLWPVKEGRAECRIYKIDSSRRFVIIQYNFISHVGERTKSEAHQIRQKIRAGKFFPVELKKFNMRYAGCECSSAFKFTTATHDIYLMPNQIFMIMNIQDDSVRKIYDAIMDGTNVYLNHDRGILCTMKDGSPDENLIAFGISSKSIYTRSTYPMIYSKEEFDRAAYNTLMKFVNAIPANVCSETAMMQKWAFQKSCFDPESLRGKVYAMCEKTDKMCFILDYVGFVSLQYKQTTNTIELRHYVSPVLSANIDKTMFALAKEGNGYTRTRDEVLSYHFTYSSDVVGYCAEYFVTRNEQVKNIDTIDDFCDWYNGICSKVEKLYTADEINLLKQACLESAWGGFWKFKY